MTQEWTEEKLEKAIDKLMPYDPLEPIRTPDFVASQIMGLVKSATYLKGNKELPHTFDTDSPHFRTDAFFDGVQACKEKYKSDGFKSTRGWKK